MCWRARVGKAGRQFTIVRPLGGRLPARSLVYSSSELRTYLSSPVCAAAIFHSDWNDRSQHKERVVDDHRTSAAQHQYIHVQRSTFFFKDPFSWNRVEYFSLQGPSKMTWIILRPWLSETCFEAKELNYFSSQKKYKIFKHEGWVCGITEDRKSVGNPTN